MKRQFYIGAQNDQLYIISGEAPSPDNDHPRHDADRTVVAKVINQDEAQRLLSLLAAEKQRGDEMKQTAENLIVALGNLRAQRDEADQIGYQRLCQLEAAESSLASALRTVEVLREALQRVIGDHSRPNDCYSTGPLTGDPIRDLVSCPSCEGLQILHSLPSRSERLTDQEDKYHELLYAVETKCPGETRHETALRYIKAAEHSGDNRTAYRSPQPYNGCTCGDPTHHGGNT